MVAIEQLSTIHQLTFSPPIQNWCSIPNDALTRRRNNSRTMDATGCSEQRVRASEIRNHAEVGQAVVTQLSKPMVPPMATVLTTLDIKF